MGLFDKKYCSVCGAKIGLLGNRKLEDGNLCKTCAGKEIREQLTYREENRAAAAAFRVTRSYGSGTKLLLDGDAKKFTVTRARDLAEANPDVLDYSQITGCELEIEDEKSEVRTKDKDGKSVSYQPPRYVFSNDFKIAIRVNHPWFDTIRFQLNPSAVKLNPDAPAPLSRRPDPRLCREYREYSALGKEIVKAVLDAREEAALAVAPQMARACPFCGATTIPDENGCCEYCGSSLNG